MREDVKGDDMSSLVRREFYKPARVAIITHSSSTHSTLYPPAFLSPGATSPDRSTASPPPSLNFFRLEAWGSVAQSPGPTDPHTHTHRPACLFAPVEMPARINR